MVCLRGAKGVENERLKRGSNLLLPKMVFGSVSQRTKDPRLEKSEGRYPTYHRDFCTRLEIRTLDTDKGMYRSLTDTGI